MNCLRCGYPIDEENPGGYHEMVHHFDVCMKLLKAAVAKLRAALMLVEWVKDEENPEYLYCPWCGNYSVSHHDSGCPRQAALSATPAPEDKEPDVAEPLDIIDPDGTAHIMCSCGHRVTGPKIGDKVALCPNCNFMGRISGKPIVVVYPERLPDGYGERS